jgi:hypothetical protein
MINNSCRKIKKSKAKKDLPVDNKMPKQQKKPPKMKAYVVDMSAAIIDINDTPDIATWNKKLHIEENASAVNANGLNDAEKIRSSRIIGIGLRDKKALKKDLIVDPANRKEMEEATKSGFTLTDEASDLSP